MEAPLPKGRQLGQVRCMLQPQGPGRQMPGPAFHPALGQLFGQFLRRRPQGVYGNGHRRRRVVLGAQGFDKVRRVGRQPQPDQPQRVGVLQRQPFRRVLLRQRRGSFLRQCPQHPVDKPGKRPQAPALHQRHRFVAGGGIWHPLHHQNLIGPRPQGPPDQRLHFAYRGFAVSV